VYSSAADPMLLSLPAGEGRQITMVRALSLDADEAALQLVVLFGLTAILRTANADHQK
jgi:hypothetical protein